MCNNIKDDKTKTCNICSQSIPLHCFLAHLQSCADHHIRLFGEHTYGPGPHDERMLSPEAQKILSEHY